MEKSKTWEDPCLVDTVVQMLRFVTNLGNVKMAMASLCCHGYAALTNFFGKFRF